MSTKSLLRIAAVLGWPVSHSRSPLIHGHWLREHQLHGAYLPLAVKPENLGPALRGLGALGFVGANLTVPHKEAALAFMDRLDDTAVRVGAVNTVTIGPDGRLTGSNTDGFGFIENIRQAYPDWKANNVRAVVLGAGGAARAICSALLDQGVSELRLTNRTREKADKLAAALGDPRVLVSDWRERSGILADSGLLVNTTTLGMEGQPALDLDLSALPSAALVTDIVYVPLMTPLLQQASNRGNPVVTGLGMLLHQARPGFEAWFGTVPAVTAALVEKVQADIS